jgi:hypothetical protein
MAKIRCKSKSSEGTTLQSVQIQSTTALQLVPMLSRIIRWINNEQPEERAKDLNDTNSIGSRERTGLRPRYTVTYHIPSTRFMGLVTHVVTPALCLIISEREWIQSVVLIQFVQLMVKESNDMAKIRCKSKSSEGTTLQSVQIQSRTASEWVPMVSRRIRWSNNEQPEERAKDLNGLRERELG